LQQFPGWHDSYGRHGDPHQVRNQQPFGRVFLHQPQHGEDVCCRRTRITIVEIKNRGGVQFLRCVFHRPKLRLQHCEAFLVIQMKIQLGPHPDLLQ